MVNLCIAGKGVAVTQWLARLPAWPGDNELNPHWGAPEFIAHFWRYRSPLPVHTPSISMSTPAWSIGWPSDTVARPTNRSTPSLFRQPAWPGTNMNTNLRIFDFLYLCYNAVYYLSMLVRKVLRTVRCHMLMMKYFEFLMKYLFPCLFIILRLNTLFGWTL